MGRALVLIAWTCTACACGRLSFDRAPDAPFDGEGGHLDPGFGTEGIAPVGTLAFMRVTSIAVQEDRLLVGGFSGPTMPNDGVYGFTLTRLASDGSVDISFGSAGFVQVVTGATSKLWALHVYGDGRILSAGYGVSGSFDYMITRHLPDGTLDLSMSGDGRYIGVGPVTSSVGNNRLLGMAVHADGRITGAGATEIFGPPTNEQTSLVRIQSNGALDAAFNGTGYVLNPMNLPTTSSSRAEDLVIDTDDSVIIVGASRASDLDWAVIKLTATGALDPSFGSGGVVTTTFAPGSSDEAETIVMASDSGYIVGGTSANQIVIAKYRRDGALDSQFGAGGLLVSELPGTNTLKQLVVVPDGRLFGVGGSAGDGSDDCALYLITEDGSLRSGLRCRRSQARSPRGCGSSERVHRSGCPEGWRDRRGGKWRDCSVARGGVRPAHLALNR